MVTKVTVTITESSPCTYSIRKELWLFSFFGISFRKGWEGRREISHHWLRSYQLPKVQYRDNFGTDILSQGVLDKGSYSATKSYNLGSLWMEHSSPITQDSDPTIGLCWRNPCVWKMLPWTNRNSMSATKGKQADNSSSTNILNFLISFFTPIHFLQSSRKVWKGYTPLWKYLCLQTPISTD